MHLPIIIPHTSKPHTYTHTGTQELNVISLLVYRSNFILGSPGGPHLCSLSDETLILWTPLN